MDILRLFLMKSESLMMMKGENFNICHNFYLP